MSESALLRDLAVVLVVSGAVTALFHQVKLPVVLGYLLAGVVIGPHTPPFAFVSDLHSIETLAELGVILLLFSIGLEFDLRKLRRVGAVAIVVALLEIPVMIGLGYTLARGLGWSVTDAIFVGAILSISSTTIIAKLLLERAQLQTDFARIILGVLIVEDVAAIVMLVLASGFATAGEIDPLSVVGAVARVLLFATAVIVLGLLTVPRLVRYVSGFAVREVLTIVVLGLCFGVAILGTELGFSAALGAFLIGAVMAETRESKRIEERVEPVRDVFSAVFFVAVGMQIDPRIVFDAWGPVLALSALTMIGKGVACAFGTIVAGHPPRTAMRVGMGLGQIGEFSFLIAGVGRASGLVSDFVYPVTVGVSAVTSALAPFRLDLADRVTDRLGRVAPRPVREFVTFYHRGLGTRFGRRMRLRLPPEAARPAARLAVGSALVIALLAVAKGSATMLHRRGVTSLVVANDLEVAVWSLWGVVSIPLLIGLWRNAGALTTLIARAAAAGATESRAIAEGLRFAMVVIGGAIFFAVAGPIFPTGVPLAMIASLVALAALVFWRGLARLQQTAEETLRELFEAERDVDPSATKAAEDDLRSLVSTRYPFDVVLEDYVVPLSPDVPRHSIQELEIRSRTGATVAAIVRDEHTIANPSPDVRLAPGDLLVLLGSREQVERAIHYLSALASRSAGERG